MKCCKASLHSKYTAHPKPKTHPSCCCTGDRAPRCRTSAAGRCRGTRSAPRPSPHCPRTGCTAVVCAAVRPFVQGSPAPAHKIVHSETRTRARVCRLFCYVLYLCVCAAGFSCSRLSNQRARVCVFCMLFTVQRRRDWLLLLWLLLLLRRLLVCIWYAPRKTGFPATCVSDGGDDAHASVRTLLDRDCLPACGVPRREKNNKIKCREYVCAIVSLVAVAASLICMLVIVVVAFRMFALLQVRLGFRTGVICMTMR